MADAGSPEMQICTQDGMARNRIGWCSAADRCDMDVMMSSFRSEVLAVVVMVMMLVVVIPVEYTPKQS